MAKSQTLAERTEAEEVVVPKGYVRCTAYYNIPGEPSGRCTTVVPAEQAKSYGHGLVCPECYHQAVSSW